MKRLISFILLCSLLTACFAGCVIPANDKNAQSSESESKVNRDTPNESDSEGKTDNDTLKEIENGNKGSGEDVPNKKENEYVDWELKEYLDQIASDIEGNSKITFFVEYEEDYYKLKGLGSYQDSSWMESSFVIRVNCDYVKAINTKWYKLAAGIDTKSLNEAFYDCYRSNFEHEEFFNTPIDPGLSLSCTSLDEFKLDYSGIKALAELEYVTQVHIKFTYGLPYDYFLE